MTTEAERISAARIREAAQRLRAISTAINPGPKRLEDHLDDVEREMSLLRSKLRDVGEKYRALGFEMDRLVDVLRAFREGDRWIWMGNPEEDDLETLSSTCVVVIRAGELRQLLAEASGESADERWGKLREHVAWIENECKRGPTVDAAGAGVAVNIARKMNEIEEEDS